MRIGFYAYDLNPGRVVRQVGACAAADFEGPAEAEAGGESAVGYDARFDAGIEKVVPSGEETLAEFVIFQVRLSDTNLQLSMVAAAG